MEELPIKNNQKRKRILLLIILMLLIPLGFILKIYSGAGSTLLNDKLAGVIYVVFWSMLAAMIFVNKSTLSLVIIVFLTTCSLEFLQLYSSPFLELIRSTFLGRSLIGNSFSWSDMFYYGIGTVLSYLWIRKINKALLFPDFK